MPRYSRQRGTAVHLRIGQPERGAVQGKRLHSARTGAQLLGRGTNQGNWGDNYEPDAAIIKGLAGQVVRTLIRWQGTAYPEGTDSYNPLAANSYLDPVNYAQFKLELDWLEAQGLWIIVAFDTDNGAGNRGLGTADWNFYDTTDTANQAKYREEFKQAWLRIAADCAQRERILCYELMPEPMPTGSNAGHAAPLSVTYFASGDDCTVVAACRAPAGSANRVIFHVGNTSTTVRNPFVAVLATDEMQVSWRGDDNVLTGAASTTGCDNRAIVASGSKVGSTKKAFLQGVQEGTTDSTAVGSAASITRARLGGTSTATNLFTGPIALLFVCKTAVTAEQRRAIERWGAWLVGAPFRGAIPA